MTHLLTWRDAENVLHEQWAYFSGPGNSTISDTIKSANGEAIYKENNNLHMFVTSYDPTLVRDTYLEIPYENSITSYIIAETDIISTSGVEYVTVDPSYIRGKSEEVESKQTAANFWFSGGNN
jgi:hypothetical protein